MLILTSDLPEMEFSTCHSLKQSDQNEEVEPPSYDLPTSLQQGPTWRPHQGQPGSSRVNRSGYVRVRSRPPLLVQCFAGILHPGLKGRAQTGWVIDPIFDVAGFGSPVCLKILNGGCW